MGGQPVSSRILLRGGRVADGIGTTVRRADVLIDGPVIAAVGNAGVSPGECAEIGLAPGSVVVPGFIDAHVHAEGPLLADGRVDGSLAQGVTTLVVGQDGESWIGANAATAGYLNRYFAPVNGALEPARDLAWISTCDRHCAGSDGIYRGQHPHPRGYGAFARLAGHYLADGPDTGYQQLARHLAANAAAAYGLRDRGRIVPGMAADLCVIGPGGLAPHATYDAPLRMATGAELVLVNGTVVWPRDRATAGQYPGRVVS
jgi:N-acyl-D-aspartate/D-glutamate deacylase